MLQVRHRMPLASCLGLALCSSLTTLVQGQPRAVQDGQPPLATGRQVEERPHWTVLLYAAVDNDWERPFMRDVRNMRRGLEGTTGLEVVMLIDRAPGYSRDARALGEDFEDSRLYRLTGGAAERLEGGEWFPEVTLTSSHELNTGAASTVRDFVRFGKQHYPAERYALWFVSHGEGPSSCPDETDGDQLFTAELTDVLEERDSVQLLGFDACLMGGVENAYQWRPRPEEFGADIFLAAAPVSSSWPYEEIFAGLRPDSEVGAPLREGEGLGAAALAAHVVAELSTQIESGRSGDEGIERDLQSWGAFDLTRVAEAKVLLDELAARLHRDGAKQALLSLRGSGLEAETYVYVWPERGSDLQMPHVDLAHLCERIAASEAFTDEARDLGRRVSAAADVVVRSSMGMGHYEGFVPGRHGLYFVFPEGDKRTRRGASYWKKTPWFTPLPIRGKDDRYGRYAWCIDGATPGNGEVENWFELMDAWFDEPTEDAPGGANGYAW